jgi:hypothetical protein
MSNVYFRVFPEAKGRGNPCLYNLFYCGYKLFMRE